MLLIVATAAIRSVRIPLTHLTVTVPCGQKTTIRQWL